LNGQSIRATISVGCASLHPATRDEHLDTLIQRADRALYTAKAGGRNQVASDASYGD